MTIRYGMNEKMLKKFFEPAAYTVGFIITSSIPLLGFFMNWYNPTPFEPYCSLGPYPFECLRDEDVECIRGGVQDSVFRASGVIVTVGIASHIIILTTSMTLIILSVMKAEKKAKNISITTGSTDSTGSGLHNNINNANAPIEIRDDATSAGAGRASQEEDLDLEKWNENDLSAYVLELANRRKMIVGQATMYVGAFLLTWIFTVISYLNESSKFIMAAKLIFQPSQGLFNSLIFVYHKIDNVRRSDDELSVWEALKIMILRPQDVTEIFINVDVVIDDLLVNRLEMLHLPHQRQTGRDIQSAQYSADQDDISSSKVSSTSEREEGVASVEGASMEGISIGPSTRSSGNRLDSLNIFFSSTRDHIYSFGGRSIEGPTVTSTATTIKR
eukprot:CAMPEP_0194122658 /NCGR_PEP_ID=MMETSP0150-20130528/51434_1 /TAXON_ID=122233 /ORGANISM="Chaetoceros debilis, Strain MM31A-1" /LENGTH=386 /DNA_ID=CAMNT_0038815603 /DNA_START=359 /DNA_END=1519 /DNA_ORIENTATION=-